MSAATDPRRVVAGWRVALRLARRDAKRARARTALVAVLVGLPLLLAAAGDVLVRSGELTPQRAVARQLGDRAQAYLEPVTPGTPLRFRLSSGGGLVTSSRDPLRPDDVRRDVTPLLAARIPAGD